MVDRYTKVVLTIIAACLVVIAFRNASISSQAQTAGPVHVIVDSVSQFAFQFTTVPVRVQQ